MLTDDEALEFGIDRTVVEVVEGIPPTGKQPDQTIAAFDSAK